MDEIVIRNAKIEDAPRILEIYAFYVMQTAITFEYVVPELDVFQERMKNIMKKYPYLVAEVDGVIVGYAYAGVFYGRAAYDWSCETTVYVERSARKCGIGKRLYAVLEDKLKKMGILNLYACVAYPEKEDMYLNKNSAQFHEHCGYETVGVFNKCGYKFEQWYNMIWMEKMIGEHQEKQAPVKWCK